MGKQTAAPDARRSGKRHREANAVAARRKLRQGGHEVLTKVCAWCKMVNDGQGGWRPAGIDDACNPRDFTHGICPRCLERVRRDEIARLL